LTGKKVKEDEIFLKINLKNYFKENKYQSKE
jgi:hypothetical protein